MIATKELDEAALAAHQAACQAAEAEMARACASRFVRTRGGRTPMQGLGPTLLQAFGLLSRTLTPPDGFWQTAEVMQVIIEVCTGQIPMVWPSETSKASAVLTLAPAANGTVVADYNDDHTTLSRFKAQHAPGFRLEAVIELLIMVGTVSAFRRKLAARYELTPAMAGTLLVANARSRDILSAFEQMLMAYNCGRWFRAHVDDLQRLGCTRPIHADRDNPFRMPALPNASDLLLYCPTGKMAGQPIDPCEALAPSPTNDFVRLIAMTRQEASGQLNDAYHPDRISVPSLTLM